MSTTPRSVHLLIAGLAAAAVTGMAALPASGSLPAPAAVPLAAALVLAGTLQVHFRWRSHTEALDVFEAALAPVLYGFCGPVAIGLAAVAKAVSQALLRIEPVKLAFNVAGWAAATAGGCAVITWTGRPPSVGSVAVALAVVAVVNHASVVAVLSLAGGRSPTRVLADLSPVIVPGWVLGGAANVAFGVLLTAAVGTEPALAVLVPLPLALLHRSHRAHADLEADRARLRGLRDVTSTLNRLGGTEDLVEVIAAVRRSFSCDVVELTLTSGPRPRVVRVGPEGVTVTAVAGPLAALVDPAGPRRVTVADAGPASGVLRDRGWQEVLVAPVVIDGQPVGALVAGGPAGVRGFADGELAVLAAMATEIAGAVARARLLTELRAERDTLARVVEHASDGIFSLDADGRVRTWNPAMTSATGMGPEVARTTGLGAVNPEDAEGRPVPFRTWTTAPDLPAQVRITALDGAERWLSCRYRRTTDPDGRPELVVVARDVTAQRELEAMRAEFVAIASHELRTPLVPIIGWASRLLSSEVTPEIRRTGLEGILRSAKRMETLVRNMLEAARIEQGGPAVDRTVVDVSATVDGLVAELAPLMGGRQVRVDLPGEPCLAHTDPVAVEQILTNLLSNAAKYSPPDSPVEVTVRDLAGEVTVSVTDHGPGIPAAEVSRVFRRYERLGGTAQPGTGLGLHVASELARALGGRVELTRTSPDGCTFTLRLPSLTSSTPDRAVPDRPASEGSSPERPDGGVG